MSFVKGKASPLPLYYRLKTHILAQIRAGTYAPGQMLPSERQLQEEHAVSRATVRQALTELVNEGVLERRQGVGTIVAAPKIAPQLFKLTSFSEDMRSRGLTPGSVTLDVQHVTPAPAVQEKLALADASPIQFVLRLRLADDKPIGVQRLYVPPWLALSDEQLRQVRSYYAMIEASNGLTVLRAHELLNAKNASASEARLLGIRRGQALINVERVSYDAQDRPIEYVEFVYRADRYQYAINLYR